MTDGTGVPRPDLDNREIALKWLGGMSLLRIATEYDCTVNTIQGRLKKAKAEFPEFDWEGRTVKIHRGASPVHDYVGMNDGKPGKSGIGSGSLIRGRDLRSR